MAKIKLHTPKHLSDNETITEFEAKDIIHVESITGEGNNKGAYFWIKGIGERRFCLESLNEVNLLLKSRIINLIWDHFITWYGIMGTTAAIISALYLFC